MDENKKIVRNFDGEEIDLTKDDLLEKLNFETANFIRRMAALFLDLLFIVIIWYICSIGLFKQVDSFMESIGLVEGDFSDVSKFLELRDLIWKLVFNLLLMWVGVNGVYFTLFPAILGKGRTPGKLFAGIGVVDAKTLEEISPTRLIIREIIGRCLIESILIIPLFVSIGFSFFRNDSKSLHDLLAKTNVIKLELYDVQD